MTKLVSQSVLLLAGVTLVMRPEALRAPRTSRAPAHVAPFAIANIHIEHNATDGDFETVVEIKGGEAGLARMAVVSPTGQPVIDVTTPAATTLGVRQLRFESPEPGNFSSLKSAYPEGVYSFTGATADGATLAGRATLRHALPPAAAVLRPAPRARSVGIDSLVITWTAVRNVTAYLLTIEQLALDVSIEARLPASVTSFAVPAGFLRPGITYQLAIGTEMGDGNISFVETTFRTAGKE